MSVLVVVVTVAWVFAGGAPVSTVATALVDELPADAWYAAPDVTDPRCSDLSPLPWCETSRIPMLRKFFADIGAPLGVPDSEVAVTMSRHVTCWIRLRGYANCSQRMCLAAGIYPENANPERPIMVVTVYTDRPASEDLAGVSQYELGPSFSFDLQPLTWNGPAERAENARPCE